MDSQPQARLYQPSQLLAVLQLSQEQIDQLVRTGQLRPIRISGAERFDSREIDQLIATYHQIAERNIQSHVQ
jgi:predicted DNA-binding transcriptional regulator AlpA